LGSAAFGCRACHGCRKSFASFGMTAGLAISAELKIPDFVGFWGGLAFKASQPVSGSISKIETQSFRISNFESASLSNLVRTRRFLLARCLLLFR
jgi:hypothetical protein